VQQGGNEMNKNTMLELIQSELSAEWGSETFANAAFVGILSGLVNETELKEYITIRGWDK
jgi:hypothetical protein